MCLCRKDLNEYQLLHSIHSVRSQLRSDLKAGSKFIQTKTSQVVSAVSAIFFIWYNHLNRNDRSKITQCALPCWTKKLIGKGTMSMAKSLRHFYGLHTILLWLWVCENKPSFEVRRTQRIYCQHPGVRQMLCVHSQTYQSCFGRTSGTKLDRYFHTFS